MDGLRMPITFILHPLCFWSVDTSATYLNSAVSTLVRIQLRAYANLPRDRASPAAATIWTLLSSHTPRLASRDVGIYLQLTVSRKLIAEFRRPHDLTAHRD